MNAAAWQGPPSDILGHSAPIQQFVARSDHAVLALQHVIAFPEGCSLFLHLAVRRGSLDTAAWRGVCESYGGYGAGPDLTATDTGLKFGVRFPDGSTATTVDNAFHGWGHPTDRPQPPMLVEASGGSSYDDRFYEGDRRLWLWPLPPPGPFEFVVEWQSLGIDTTATALDGSAIVHAAEQALPYWP
ncbi:hypothetical protein ACFFMN_25610 [Planobispora siamensis]|uniref:Uncharacterized protein n=1 Tax=Planobispora siamensis TaxID=936338 RepID=A0A8J3SJK3_9ACTN|nr:hypothetical protein [Planobispora siamensis]GIH94122.1 hypothetical protein Psi01_47520 [Planobispora siamensis]